MNIKKKKRHIGVINSLMKILFILKVFLQKHISTNQSKSCTDSRFNLHII